MTIDKDDSGRGMAMFRNIDGGDVAAVDVLLRAAFDSADEAGLVRALRTSGDMAHEWVLDDGAGPFAYAALSRMQAPAGWLCLAPVAVTPERQGQGAGGQLLRRLAHWAVATGQSIVVLGEVDLYEKAGFRQARAARLRTPYPVAHTLLLRPGDDRPEVRLVYPAPFAALG